MKKNNLIALMSVSLCVLFLSCSSFDNDIVNEKISDWEQLQRIKDLQADYDVEFEIKMKDGKPILSVNQAEELCKIIYYMKSASRNVIKGKNKYLFSSRANRTRSQSEPLKIIYEGSHSNSYYDEYGSFDYTISWDGYWQNESFHGKVSHSVDVIPSGTWFYIEETSFTYSFEHSNTLYFCINFSVIAYIPYSGTYVEAANFSISDEILY